MKCPHTQSSSVKSYARRRPERTPLHRAVSQALPQFQDQVHDSGQALPHFINDTFRRYLSCGDLRYGFARLYCQNCKHNRLVAFSCKKRGVCPSCAGRNMSQRALRHRDQVLPHTRIRQWVLTFPKPLHLYLAYSPDALTDATEVFIDTLRDHYRRACLPSVSNPPESYDVDYLKAYYTPRHPNDLGAITSIQRHTDALTLFTHLHTLVNDGLFTSADHDVNSAPRASVSQTRFVTSPSLTSSHLKDLLILYERRLTRRFIRRGYLRPTDPSLPASEQTFTLSWGDHPPTEEERHLLRCYAASDKLRHAFGPRAGEPLRLDLDEADIKPKIDQELCVTHSGFNLHAETVIEPEDRDQLERLSRYIQRPVIAHDRLIELEDGRFYYRFNRVWKSGAKGIFFKGPDFLERLAGVIPPPRKHPAPPMVSMPQTFGFTKR